MIHYFEPDAEIDIIKNKDLYCAYFSSDMFSEQCAVSITSLFETNKDFDSITVFILEEKISEKNKERIKWISKEYGRQVIFIKMPLPEEFWNDSRLCFENVGRTFGRMILGQVLPSEVNKVLCLDSDLLFEDSIMELWNTDLRDTYLAGVLNGVGDKVLTKLLDAPKDIPYFNGGVYLINLELVRKDCVERLYYEYMKKVFDEGKTLGAYEEEVMNKVCYPKVKILHPRYNVMSINLVMNYEEFLRFRGTSYYYSKELIDEAVNNPAIVHIANVFYLPLRAWEAGSDIPFSDEYRRYRSLTPWKDDAPIESSRGLKNRLMKRIWHFFPRRMSFALAAFVRNDIRPMLKKKRDDE